MLEKPDDNLMSNEIISFVPTGYEIEIEPKDGNKDESQMSNEIISFIPVEENDVQVSTFATLNVTQISKKTTSDELKNETKHSFCKRHSKKRLVLRVCHS